MALLHDADTTQRASKITTTFCIQPDFKAERYFIISKIATMKRFFQLVCEHR
jgi:hypothetical protein